MKLEEQSKYDALNMANLPYLPEEYVDMENSDRIWTRAICHVIKCDGSKNYCIARNDGFNSPIVINDFGNPSRIFKIDKVFPYEFVDRKELPIFTNRKDIIVFLANNGYDASYIENLFSPKDEYGNPKSKEKKAEDKEEIKKLLSSTFIKYNIEKIDEKKGAEKQEEQHGKDGNQEED